MNFAEKQLVSSKNSAVDFSTEPVLIILLYGLSFQIFHAGAAIDGTYYLEASNKPGPKESLVDADFTIVSQQAVTGSGSYFPNFNGAFFKWARIRFAANVGSVGTTDIYYVAKG